MKKVIKRILKIFLLFLLLFIVLLVFVCKLEISGVNHQETNADYSNIMAESINGNPRVVDIAMLGAHDAFTSKIKGKNDVDPSETEGILTNKFLKFIASGMFARSSKTQVSSAKTLFEKGVRYFDIRLSYHNNSWFAKHGLISSEFEYYLNDIIDSLIKNKGEFVILDFQHVYTGVNDLSFLVNYLQDHKYEGYSIFDFVHFNSLKMPLKDLRYNDVVNNKSESGAIIILKSNINFNNSHYLYADSIRSNWHNTNNTDILFEKMNDEYLFLKNNDQYDNHFRINQAQLTQNTSDILNMIFSWSLVKMAAKSNKLLLEIENFILYLEEMPIVMVDYADSNNNDFNNKIIDIINIYNSK